MLSYETPLVNGQTSPTLTNIPTTRQAMAASSQALSVAAAAPVLASGRSLGSSTETDDHSIHGREEAPARRIFLVTGPAGCGKSTVGRHIAKNMNIPYVEGDEFHPKANIERMSAGIPLTDADRWDWLTALREEALRQINAGHDGVVVTCSALKRKYRDVIRVAPYFQASLKLHLYFIYLHAPKEVLLERIRARQNHYMGANMVDSQFDILEPPTSEETDVISIDVSRPQGIVQKDALEEVQAAIDHEVE